MAGSPVLGTLKSTLGYSGEGTGSAVSIRSTAGLAPVQPPGPVNISETIDEASSLPPVTPTSSARSLNATAVRTTVLPRRKSPQAAEVTELRPRFDRVRTLGQGGMGEVELARDNDIRRTVAVKRLRSDVQSEEALHRFADEVRIVGQLEHPAIVPVYDVGRDESGQVYLVMKHLNGETMEDIIAKLRAGDPSYAKQYTTEYRVHLFLGILDAIRYAHARGIIHRDLKPANIMIGPFGEVTVLDWGIAKPIAKSGTAKEGVQPLERTFVESQGRIGDETQLGSLAGTPLYMSPEQAAGRNDELDERSDVYALCLLLFEWLSLEHPLRNKKTVTEVLAALISEDFTAGKLRPLAGTMGMEYLQIVCKGLVRDRDQRIRSVAELETLVKKGMTGTMDISCHVTLTKRVAHGALHWIDRHPLAYTLMFLGVVMGMLATLGFAGYKLLH